MERYSVRMRQNSDQNNSKYEHFLRSAYNWHVLEMYKNINTQVMAKDKTYFRQSPDFLEQHEAKSNRNHQIS